tara:strand:+ start:10916 stop:11659 length:744 start_codon:yes stop_codon:yes gene_type:complete
MKNKEKLILENFSKVFNKIKRLNETELTEIDYEKVYADTNPWDKQGIKIDDYPTEGKNLDYNIESARKALEGDRQERNRFLMDDNEVRGYYNKLLKIKDALNKNENGEELSDFEKKVVRFYKSNKQSQKGRISNAAGKKLDSNFVVNFDKSQFKEFEHTAIEIYSMKTKEKGKGFIKDIKPEQTDDDVRFRVKCNVNGVGEGEFLMYSDGSSGFVGDEKFSEFKVYDEKFRNLAMSTLRKVRPEKNY